MDPEARPFSKAASKYHVYSTFAKDLLRLNFTRNIGRDLIDSARHARDLTMKRGSEMDDRKKVRLTETVHGAG